MWTEKAHLKGVHRFFAGLSFSYRKILLPHPGATGIIPGGSTALGEPQEAIPSKEGFGREAR